MLKNISIQIIFFVVIFNGISWFKETSMLSADTQLPNEAIVLNNLMGDKIELLNSTQETVIYFFAPWCQICHLSIENLEEFYLENPNIRVVAVALDFLEINEVKDFVKQHQLTFPIALGNEAIKQQFSVPGYPSYYVIDNKNTIINKSLGYSTKVGMQLRTF